MLFHALGWTLVLLLLVLWSLAAWLFHLVANWTLSQADVLAGAPGSGGAVALPDWLAPWVPPELLQALAAAMAGLQPALDWLASLAPALAGGVSVLTWLVWGLGALLLVLAGAVGSGLVALSRDRRPAAA